MTDASLLLGYLDPAHFLGGAMDLDLSAARTAVERALAVPLGLDIPDAALAVLEIATEQMVHAIEEITINQGIDPRTAVVVGGGGAAGLNSVAIARRLGCSSVVFPVVGAALSAAGALLSDLVREFSATLPTSSSSFAFEEVNRTLDGLSERCELFLEASGGRDRRGVVEYWAEARYPHQVWELELALRGGHFSDQADVDRLVEDFHQMHREVFAVNDPDSPVEIIGWHARARVALGERARAEDVIVEPRSEPSRRSAYFPGVGKVDVPVQPLLGLVPGSELIGPAIIEAELTTIVLPPGATGRRSSTGGVVVESWNGQEEGTLT